MKRPWWYLILLLAAVGASARESEVGPADDALRRKGPGRGQRPSPAILGSVDSRVLREPHSGTKLVRAPGRAKCLFWATVLGSGPAFAALRDLGFDASGRNLRRTACFVNSASRCLFSIWWVWRARCEPRRQRASYRPTPAAESRKMMAFPRPTTNSRSPSDVAVDALGNIYVADSGNNQVRESRPCDSDSHGGCRHR